MPQTPLGEFTALSRPTARFKGTREKGEEREEREAEG